MRVLSHLNLHCSVYNCGRRLGLTKLGRTSRTQERWDNIWFWWWIARHLCWFEQMKYEISCIILALRLLLSRCYVYDVLCCYTIHALSSIASICPGATAVHVCYLATRAPPSPRRSTSIRTRADTWARFAAAYCRATFTVPPDTCTSGWWRMARTNTQDFVPQCKVQQVGARAWWLADEVGVASFDWLTEWWTYPTEMWHILWNDETLLC